MLRWLRLHKKTFLSIDQLKDEPPFHSSVDGAQHVNTISHLTNMHTCTMLCCMSLCTEAKGTYFTLSKDPDFCLTVPHSVSEIPVLWFFCDKTRIADRISAGCRMC